MLVFVKNTPATRWSSPMPRPTPIPLRKAILQRSHSGQSVSQIAEELGLPERTVRRLVNRFHQRGDAGLTPDYHHPAPAPDAAQRVLYCAALDLRRAHPNWGAEYLRINLRRMGHCVPTARTIQRWLRKAGLAPAPAGRPPRGDPSRATAPHDVWQIDACERLALKMGEASWLRVVDECSGAVLATVVFPPRFLGRGRSQACPGGSAQGIRALGTPRASSDRQRHTVGRHRRTANRSHALADRPGGGCHLEPSPRAAEERRCRTVPGCRAELAGTRNLFLSGRTPGTSPSFGSPPARRVSRNRRANAYEGISRTKALGTTVSPPGRSAAMDRDAGAELVVRARGASFGESQWEGLPVRSRPLGWSAPHR